MRFSAKTISVYNTGIPKNYMTINEAYVLEEDAKDVIFELITPKKGEWAREVRNYIELRSFARAIEILESQQWNETIKYALHAAKILAALPPEKPRVRHVVSVWRAKN